MPKKMDRREFLKNSALFTCGALLASKLDNVFAHGENEEAILPHKLSQPENIIHTVCLQCNTGCGIKAKLNNGVITKIDGNPYSPWTLWPYLSYETSPIKSAPVDGGICPKGQSGIQAVYDPYRIVKVLKRTGPRGSNKWQTIDFHQAISEIVNGGTLFSHVSGEKKRVVEGLKDICVLKDSKLSKDMSKDLKHLQKDIKKMHKEKLPKEEFQKKLTEKIKELKDKYKDSLNVLIDPDHPDFGPKNNQFLMFWGRQKGGRSEFTKRFGESFGTVNMHGHTTVCQGSLYFTGKAVSEQFDFDAKSKEDEAKWTGGKKFYWQSDTAHAKFILAVGSALFEGGYGPSPNARKLMTRHLNKEVEIAVVDPRFSKLASKADKWIPAKPGTEAAFALGVMRWMFEKEKYNKGYLENANKAAAEKDKEPNWTTASWLVKLKKGKPSEYLHGSDIGVPEVMKTHEDKKKKETFTYKLDKFVVLRNGRPVAFDPNDEGNSAEGDLLVDGEVNGIKVKSALQIIKESSYEKTIEEWAKICEVSPDDIRWCAKKLTSFGRQAVCELHRGVSQHTNGFYNVFAWFCVNFLIGNVDYKGGFITGSAFDAAGGKEGKPYDLKELISGKIKSFGISIIRHGVKYEETSIFAEYPAKRPWFPFSSDVYQEIIPSLGDTYPYPIKAAIMYCAAPTYSLPAAHKNIEILRDVKKLPLFIASDITVGATSVYADYIFPDISFLERFDYHGSHPSVATKVGPFYHPVVNPMTETVKVFGEEMPLSYESLLLGIAEELKLKGFGKDGFDKGLDFKRPEDFYMKMAANVAFGDKKDGSEKIPEASSAEVDLFIKSHKHISKSSFDLTKLEKAAGKEHFKRIIFMLNRGGRFNDYKKMYKGDVLDKKYGRQIDLYLEKIHKGKNSMTGKSFPGYPLYLPIADSLGNPIQDQDEGKGFRLLLITNRDVHFTKSRSVTNYWLLTMFPENYILINRIDAKALGVGDGQKVKVVSASNPDGVWDLGFEKKPMIGKVKITEGIKPGIITFCLGFGHWAYGAKKIKIDGKSLPVDLRRGKGIHANAAMRVDPYLNNTCLQDLVGGSVSFYDTKVKLVGGSIL